MREKQIDFWATGKKENGYICMLILLRRMTIERKYSGKIDQYCLKLYFMGIPGHMNCFVEAHSVKTYEQCLPTIIKTYCVGRQGRQGIFVRPHVFFLFQVVSLGKRDRPFVIVKFIDLGYPVLQPKTTVISYKTRIKILVHEKGVWINK